MSKGLTTAEADTLLKMWGRNELEEKKTPKWVIFCSQLIEPMVTTNARPLATSVLATPTHNSRPCCHTNSQLAALL